jgi:hypothetical protein
MGWVTLDDGQHVYIGSRGEFMPRGPGSPREERHARLGTRTAPEKIGTMRQRAAAMIRAKRAREGKGVKPADKAHGAGPGGMAKAAASLREQAAAARAGKGAPEERGLAAAVKYSFWRSGAPTAGLGAGKLSRQEASSKVIEAGAAKHPSVYAKARAAVDAKIAGFAAKRETPVLALGEHEGKLTVKQYDAWGGLKGTKTITPHTPVNEWERRKTDMPAKPVFSEHEEREYKAIGKRTTLEPTKAEIATQRKVQGITGRIKQVIFRSLKR